MFDTITIDHVDNLVYPPPDFIDMEEYYDQKDIIMNQIIYLNNLGTNLLENIEEGPIKNKIYQDIIDYTREHYLVIADKDYILNNEQLRQTANLIYQFLIVDGFNIIIPKLIEQTNTQTLEQFDKLLFHKRDDQYIKKSITENLSDVVKNLLKLQKFADVIADNTQYKELVNRFGNYLELIDFSDCERYTENYLKPVLNKYFTQILWRTLTPISSN